MDHFLTEEFKPRMSRKVYESLPAEKQDEIDVHYALMNANIALEQFGDLFDEFEMVEEDSREFQRNMDLARIHRKAEKRYARIADKQRAKTGGSYDPKTDTDLIGTKKTDDTEKDIRIGTAAIEKSKSAKKSKQIRLHKAALSLNK